MNEFEKQAETTNAIANGLVDGEYEHCSKWVPLETAQKLRKDLTDEIHRLDKEVASRNKKLAQIREILNEPDPHGEKYKEKLYRLREEMTK